MSFPVDGMAVEIREWSRIKDFEEPIIQSFAKWNAKAMLGVTENVVMRRAGDDGERLWALLNTARSLQGKFVAYSSIVCVCLSIVLYDASRLFCMMPVYACRFFCMMSVYACRLFCMMPVYAYRLFCMMSVYACRLFCMMFVSACRLFCMMPVYACRLFCMMLWSWHGRGLERRAKNRVVRL